LINIFSSVGNNQITPRKTEGRSGSMKMHREGCIFFN